MKVVTLSDLVFACYSRACAPPPVGTGGSSGGKGGGGRGAALAATRKFGVRQASKGSGRKISSDNVQRPQSDRVKKALADWKKSGDPNDQRDEKSTARAMTQRYGTRRKSAQKEHEDSRQRARELTARYARG